MDSKVFFGVVSFEFCGLEGFDGASFGVSGGNFMETLSDFHASVLGTDPQRRRVTTEMYSKLCCEKENETVNKTFKEGSKTPTITCIFDMKASFYE